MLAVVTIALAVTDRLGLYINPESTWFAVTMSVVVLLGAVASFALPLGAGADHGHDHGDAHDHDDHAHEHRRHPLATAATAVGGTVASVVVVSTLVLPPASLSAELAMSRDVGAAPLFGGADTIQLASTGDTGSFGIGEWATAFATATDPDAFDGEPVELTGFATPRADGGFALTRLVITHCVIDAQPASVPIAASDLPETGQWVTVTGTVRWSSDGSLVVEAVSVQPIPEPEDPYEY